MEEIVPVLVGKLLENNLITEKQADQIICAIFNDNDRLNEIRELNPDYDISMHKLNVCVGDSQYRLVYCIYVEHKESGISVHCDEDGTRRVKDTIHIPMSLVASFGSFD